VEPEGGQRNGGTTHAADCRCGATAEPEAQDLLAWLDAGAVRKRMHLAPYREAAEALAGDPQAFAALVTGMLTLVRSCYPDPPAPKAAEPIGDGPAAAAMECARTVFPEYVAPPSPPGYVDGAWLWYRPPPGCYREAWPEPWPGFGRYSECRVWIDARTEVAALALFEQHVHAGHNVIRATCPLRRVFLQLRETLGKRAEQAPSLTGYDRQLWLVAAKHKPKVLQPWR
jgi:hypothetical protein